MLTSKITRKNLNRFLSTKASSKLTLNLGCGSTDHTKYFPNIINTDIVQTPQTNLVSDVHQLPFKSNSVSLVLCTEVLEHTYNPQQAINEIQRILKPNGKLILTTRFIFPIHESPNDYFRFTKYGLKYLLRNWKRISIHEEADTQTTLAIILQRLAFQTQILVQKGWINALFHLLAQVIAKSPNIFIKQFGDITRKKPEANILVSGYYLVAQQ